MLITVFTQYTQCHIPEDINHVEGSSVVAEQRCPVEPFWNTKPKDVNGICTEQFIPFFNAFLLPVCRSTYQQVDKFCPLRQSHVTAQSCWFHPYMNIFLINVPYLFVKTSLMVHHTLVGYVTNLTEQKSCVQEHLQHGNFGPPHVYKIESSDFLMITTVGIAV